MKTVKSSALTLLFLLCACGGGGPDTGMTPQGVCGDETRADTFVQGLEKSSEGQMFTIRLLEVKVEEQVSAPDRGFNTWTLELMDSNGNPMDPSLFTLRPWMPDHGHGTTPLIQQMRSTETAGKFEVGPFDLFMNGFWEFTVNVESDGQSDQTKLGFCLEG